MRRLIPCLLMVVPAPARADLVGGVNVLAAWTRQAGAYSDVENPDRGRVEALDPYRSSLRLRTRKLYDLQYGASRHYKVAPLKALVESYGRRRNGDLVILHFENGMQVPLPRAALDRLGAHLAVEACDARGRRCEPSFDDVGKEDDPRPIRFSWNKLVVAKPWHPDVEAGGATAFSPWHHTDSLTGIELADARAYAAQFELGEPEGLEVHRARCQFCHGARQVGARFGWDFVTPLALHEKRPPANLLNHVKYPKVMASRLGLQMPNQPDVTLEEMRSLWRWMRAAAKRPLKRYEP